MIAPQGGFNLILLFLKDPPNIDQYSSSSKSLYISHTSKNCKSKLLIYYQDTLKVETYIKVQFLQAQDRKYSIIMVETYRIV